MLVVKKNKSINFSPLGTKLYFHVNSLRKNYIVLTFNKAAFSCGCKPRNTSYLILLVQFDLLPSHRRHTPGICSFLSFLVVYSPPLGMQKETIPHPRAPDQPYICVLGYIFSRAKLISINFSKLMCWVWFLMHNSYQATTPDNTVETIPSIFKRLHPTAVSSKQKK